MFKHIELLNSFISTDGICYALEVFKGLRRTINIMAHDIHESMTETATATVCANLKPNTIQKNYLKKKRIEMSGLKRGIIMEA